MKIAIRKKIAENIWNQLKTLNWLKSAETMKSAEKLKAANMQKLAENFEKKFNWKKSMKRGAVRLLGDLNNKMTIVRTNDSYVQLWHLEKKCPERYFLATITYCHT